MKPTTKLWVTMIGQIGSDTVTFAPKLAAAMWILLVKVPFTPGLGLTLTDATDLATFIGSTPLAITAAVRPAVNDPLTSRQTINLPPPAGGFLWTCSTAPSPPETIYGVALSSSSTTVNGASLLAADLLDTPVTITNVNDFVKWTENQLEFNPAMVS